METEQARSQETSQPAVGGRFGWLRFAFWLPACLVMGVVVAWIAEVAQSYFAPLVIFPLLVGVVLGAMAVGLMRVVQVGNRPTIVLGTVLAVAVTVAGQHYLGYRTACQRAMQDAQMYRNARLGFPAELRGKLPRQPAPPADLADFLRRQATRGRPLLGGYIARGGTAWLTWAVDGVLVLAAAVAMVVPAMRQPYCDRCQSWYRVIRSGRIDVPTARRLADVAGVAAADKPTAARYRLLTCNGGCGPTGFDLCWDRWPGGACLVQTWLDAGRRDRITQVLDEARGMTDG